MVQRVEDVARAAVEHCSLLAGDAGTPGSGGQDPPAQNTAYFFRTVTNETSAGFPKEDYVSFPVKTVSASICMCMLDLLENATVLECHY